MWNCDWCSKPKHSPPIKHVEIGTERTVEGKNEINGFGKKSSRIKKAIDNEHWIKI